MSSVVQHLNGEINCQDVKFASFESICCSWRTCQKIKMCIFWKRLRSSTDVSYVFFPIYALSPK